jgi:CO/xanthine dehydrogenase Mo-binding subunit
MSDTLPLSIQNNRRMEKWIRFQPDRTVRLAVGKVELGQGNVTALAQIAADELDVNLDRISVLSGDTQDAPDEGQTTSSQSIEVSGRSVRLVSAELRARVLDRLAQRLNCSPTELSVEDGIFRRGDAPTGHDYWSFAAAEDFARDIDGSATPKPHTAYRYVGKATPRRDLPAKVVGAAFIHDIVRPDMLHARILRQPCRGARLASLDEAAIRRAERGDFRVVRVGNFVAFVGSDETVVQRAAAVAPLHAKWDNVRQIASAQQEAAGLVGQPCDERVHGDPVAATVGTVVSASYSRPYVAHASMAPSCALAEYRGGHLSVWSHTQGPYPLRSALANVLGVS